MTSAAIFTTACVVGYRFLSLSWMAVRFPYPLDYGEGAVLDASLRLAHLQNVYPLGLTSSHWFVSNYPPLYYLVHVPFIWAHGGPALWQGRLISGLSAIATAGLIAYVLFALTRDRAASAIGGLTFLAVPLVAVWAQYDRVDMLALFLSWCGIAACVRWRTGEGVGLAVACFVASSFTRQTAALAGLIGAYAWFRATAGTSAANKLIGWTALVGVTIFLALCVVTRGAFFFHVVTGTAGRMSLDQLTTLGRSAIVLMPFLLALAVTAALSRAWSTPPGSPLVAAYLIGAVLVALTAAKVGSYINYFLDLSAACSLAAGASIAWLRPHRRILTICLLVLVVQAVKMGRSNSLYDHLSSRLRWSSEYARLQALVRNEPSPILADEPMALLPLNGRTIEFQPFAMTQLAETGVWDETPFLEELRNHRFTLILLREPDANPGVVTYLWEPRVAHAIVANYQAVGSARVDDYAHVVIYRPRAFGTH